MRKLLLFALCIALVGCAGAEKKVYVTAVGNDAVPQGGEVATSIQEGIALAGKYTTQGENVTLLIAGGDYSIDTTLEVTSKEIGTTNGKLTIKPLNDNKVRIFGGIQLPVNMVEKAPAQETRIQDGLQDSILRIDLAQAGVKTLGELRNSGFGRPALPAWTEVFINEKAQKLSRWPNDTMALMGKVLDTGSVPREGDLGNKGGTFEYYGDRPSKWKSGDPKWIAGYFAWGYADDMIRVAKIDTQKKTITASEATVYGFASGEDFNRYYVVNLLEEVDVPGEYYLDYPNKVLWMYPSETINTLSLSLLAEPMMAIEGVKNVTVEGLEFTCARGMGIYLENTENVLIKGCDFNNLGSLAICIGRGTAPQKQLYDPAPCPPASRILGSLASTNYENPVFNRNGGKNNGVVDCVITEVGAGGISLGGGDRETLTPAGNYVENCRISRYNRVEKASRPAIQISGVGNKISHCEIFDAPSSAIMLQGNDHLVEFCEIYNVCNEIDDLSAFYYGRDPSDQGNRLMYNYVHDLSPKHRVTAFYHDDGACGMYVYGNILYKAGLFPVLIGGGSDNYYENNMIIDSPYGIYIDDRLENWCDTPYMDSLFQARMDAVHYDQAPFKDKYPLAANYFIEGFKIPKRNVATRNLFYNIDELIRQGSRVFENGHIEMYNNWVTMMRSGFTKPGFVDEENANWNLTADAPLFKYIDGFKALPFDEMGCSLPKE